MPYGKTKNYLSIERRTVRLANDRTGGLKEFPTIHLQLRPTRCKTLAYSEYR